MGAGAAGLVWCGSHRAARPPLPQALSRGDAVDMGCPLCGVCGLVVWEVTGGVLRLSPGPCGGRCSELFTLRCVLEAVSCLGHMCVCFSGIVFALWGVTECEGGASRVLLSEQGLGVQVAMCVECAVLRISAVGGQSV